MSARTNHVPKPARKMRGRIFIRAWGVAACAALAPQQAAAECLVNREMLKQFQVGMSYEQIVAIVGCEGERAIFDFDKLPLPAGTARPTPQEIADNVSYHWRGEEKAWVYVLFERGKYSTSVIGTIK